MADQQESAFPVNTENEFSLITGTNMANHSTALAGRAKFVKVGIPIPVFRTKQEVYRFCAYALALAETLPHEGGEHTFEEVREAIQNS
jgi:hypothetical protein